MKVVLDTNAFISCIGKKSPWRNVFDAFIEGKFTLVVSNEVVLEYEEKFTEFWGVEVAKNLMGFLATSENLLVTGIYFQFFLVQNDEDDNKFADTYISANADYLVSNDRALVRAGENAFPPVKVITLQEFSTLLS